MLRRIRFLWFYTLWKVTRKERFGLIVGYFEGRNEDREINKEWENATLKGWPD
ncbi:MAG: hypothetical protein UY15_C0002G0020 [Parcubacteria group bacterium GW2011_GWA2_47_9]|nr:MAG: hypothetical protein UY15_C0002G0020 [Parcubacteria group bacterium GW2011_GWA2_47_9]